VTVSCDTGSHHSMTLRYTISCYMFSFRNSTSTETSLSI